MRKKFARQTEPVIRDDSPAKNPDLFIVIVNNNADRRRAEADRAELIQEVRSKAVQDTLYGILGVVLLLGGIAWAIAQFL